MLPNILTETEYRFHGSKRVQGHVCDCADSIKLFLARKKHGNLYRADKKTISGAILEEICGWALDERLILTARAKSCTHLGVRTTDTNDYYVAPISYWFNRRYIQNITPTSFGSTVSKRVLLLQYFEITKGNVELKVKDVK